MARPSKSEQLAKIHNAALTEFDRVQSAVREERLQCLEDRRFYSIAGAQWEGSLGEAFANKPRFEFNKVHLAVIRIINEYRNNRITVDFAPRDGEPDDELADTCDGLYRADERASGAEEAYDNAFEEAVGGGMGAWRLRAHYEDEDDDEDTRQRVRMEPIHDAESTVFFDLGAKRQDKSDARRAWVLTPYTHDAFEEEFGHSPSTWPRDIQRTEFDWCTPDIVWVSEYYAVEEKTELVRYFRGLDEEAEDMAVPQRELDNDPEKLGELLATGFREVRQKRRKVRKVHKYILSGLQVEEDCGYIAGQHIPIVVTYGKRWVVDGVERCMGHVRLAKDAQRLMNSLMSWLAEMATRFDIEKPIVSPEQIAGHAQMWASDNVEKFPFLLLNQLKDANDQPIPGSAAPQGYTKAPNIPPAMAALAEIAGKALEDLLGNQQAGEMLQPNQSGKAVELIQQRLDMQVFIYVSNFAKAMRRSGEIWLSMMRDLVVEDGRRMKVINSNGDAGSVVMNEPAYNKETAETYTRNSLDKANFEVDVDVGPSSTSRRAATVRALTQMMALTQDPQDSKVLNGLVMMNLEGEGLSDARDYFRRQLLRMGVVKPSEEEATEMASEQANAKPSAQDEYLQSAAEQARADAGKKRADTVETIASAGLKLAQADKVAAETAGAHQEQRLTSAAALRDMLAQPAPAALPSFDMPGMPTDPLAGA